MSSIFLKASLAIPSSCFKDSCILRRLSPECIKQTFLILSTKLCSIKLINFLVVRSFFSARFLDGSSPSSFANPEKKSYFYGWWFAIKASLCIYDDARCAFSRYLLFSSRPLNIILMCDRKWTDFLKNQIFSLSSFIPVKLGINCITHSRIMYYFSCPKFKIMIGILNWINFWKLWSQVTIPINITIRLPYS